MGKNTNYKSFRYKEADLGKFNSNAKNVADMIVTNCRILGLTNGQFSLIDLVKHILDVVGKSDVICVTWSAGIKDANQVAWMQNSNMINSFTLITDHSYVNRQKSYSVALDNLFGKQNIRTSEIHAKFTLIKNENWNIVIRTSMNLNANKTCESFEIDDDKDIFEFYNSFVEHIYKNQPEGMVANTNIAQTNMNSFFDSTAKKTEDTGFNFNFNFSES
jgi:hypothetical protein